PDRCVSIYSSPESVIATVCESDTTYEFNLGGDLTTHHKNQFRRDINFAIENWWTSHNQSLRHLINAKIEIWLTVPEANPAAAQARAVILTSKGRVSLSFDLQEGVWIFSDANAGILAEKDYPDSYGWRPQQLLIATKTGADEAELERILIASGIALGAQSSPGWFQAKTKFMDEQDAIKRLKILDKHQDYVRAAQLNTLFEWIAYRGRCFSFNWSAQ
ncbi:MAG: hypothetical protein NTV34_08555, partial [Proteobacteria bacterium]|nr:hypothetical protein [Pseudomonadota bacterium]